MADANSVTPGLATLGPNGWVPSGNSKYSGLPVGAGGGTVVERFARKVQNLRHLGYDPQFREMANLPAPWVAGQYKKGKVVANASQTLFWIASGDGSAVSAAAPTHTDATMVSDSNHNWQFMGPIGPERLTRKPTLFTAAGSRVAATYLRTGQNNTALDATFVGQFGAASNYDQFTQQTTTKVQDVIQILGSFTMSSGGGLESFVSDTLGTRSGSSDTSYSFYTDSPRVGVLSVWDNRGRLEVDGVDITFSEEIDPPTGDGAATWQRSVWRDLNFGWTAVRKIVVHGSNSCMSIVINKGYRIWPATDEASVVGAYYGDSTAAGGGPAPIRYNDQWIPSIFKLLTGTPSSVRFALGGIGYSRDALGGNLSTTGGNLLSSTLLSQNLIDQALSGRQFDYVWLDQTSWDIPGIDATYPTMDQFESAFVQVANVWLQKQPNAVIIVSTYRGPYNSTQQALTDPYVARLKDICNRVIPKDRLLMIDPYNKKPQQYLKNAAGAYSGNVQTWFGPGNGYTPTDGAHPSQLYLWHKAREAAQDLLIEINKVLAGVDRGYGA